jgi:glycoprotein endo-alpha-1,2-mannosidase
MLGAYYYSWYPENLAAGSLGSHLVPPAGPDPATEVSSDPVTAERAISQASSAGIKFFALDWWPNRPALNGRIDSGFLQASNLSSTHFAIMYETEELGAGIPYQITTPMTPAATSELVANMVSIAREYFSNPQYLRINGRPVIFWYLTRTMTGDVAGAVAQVRAALGALGYDVLLIGDEIFWRVTTSTGGLTTAPDVARARLFDAITWYNLYDASTPSLAGYGASSGFLSSIDTLVQSYQTALGGTVPIVPSVIPGYNDRATRPTEGHPAIPREWGPGDADGSFLRHMFEDVALPAVDPRVPIVMITSWNEWNEQTAIEPVSATATTTTDDSASGTFFTQGYPYGGSGDAALNVVRQVATGQITATPSRLPISGPPG